MKTKSPSWSLVAILQKHAPSSALRLQSPKKSVTFHEAAQLSPVRSRAVQPRTISDIQNIAETKAGNELLFDEFGDLFQQSSVAGDNSFGEDLWTPAARKAAAPHRDCRAPTTPHFELRGLRPNFEDASQFIVIGAPFMSAAASSSSLGNPNFLVESSISKREEPPSSSLQSLGEPKVDPVEIDEKLQELLAICRPLSSGVLGDAQNTGYLLQEVTHKLKYVKEERNVLKAKLILKFLSEYRKHREEETKGADKSEYLGEEQDKSSPEVSSSKYFFTPTISPAKQNPQRDVLSPDKLSKTPPHVRPVRSNLTRTQKGATRSKSPAISKRADARAKTSPLRSRTPLMTTHRLRKEALLARISTPNDLVASLAQ